MKLRALALAGVLGLLCVTGCNTSEYCRKEQHPAPSLKGGYLRKLGTEIGWFYASVQDAFFGINYYCDMEHEFPSHLYE